jgi:hypothetical protein
LVEGAPKEAIVKHLVFDAILVSSTALIAFDNWRMRRRLRVDRLVREAEEALGPPRIGDIDMPDPSDSRWAWKEMPFTTAGRTRKEHALVLGSVTVAADGEVYIGSGPPVPDGRMYGKRVLHAYKRRLAEASRSSS